MCRIFCWISQAWVDAGNKLDYNAVRKNGGFMMAPVGSRQADAGVFGIVGSFLAPPIKLCGRMCVVFWQQREEIAEKMRN